MQLRRSPVLQHASSSDYVVHRATQRWMREISVYQWPGQECQRYLMSMPAQSRAAMQKGMDSMPLQWTAWPGLFCDPAS